MRLHLLVVGFFIVFAGAQIARSELAPAATSLAQSIAAFNAKALEHAIGRDQPPLTEDEVVAAIQLADHKEHAESPHATFDAFKRIADTRQLPPQGEFEFLDGIDPGEEVVFDVWYVRIRLAKPDGGSYGFTIRNRVIRARPVGEVADELEKYLKGQIPMPGSYRLEDRLKNLKERAAAAAEKAKTKN